MNGGKTDVALTTGVQIIRRNGRWYITNAEERKMDIFALAQELVQITTWTLTTLKEDAICLELVSGKAQITITNSEVTCRIKDEPWFTDSAEGKRLKQFLDRQGSVVYDSGSRNNLPPDAV